MLWGHKAQLCPSLPDALVAPTPTSNPAPQGDRPDAFTMQYQGPRCPSRVLDALIDVIYRRRSVLRTVPDSPGQLCYRSYGESFIFISISDERG
jgi:hypothetical protein